MRTYSEAAIDRAKDDAKRWLDENQDGYPRSWAQEEADTKRRGYDLYDDFEAPPIAGYEALEREGFVKRLETLTAKDQERVHFVPIDGGGNVG